METFDNTTQVFTYLRPSDSIFSEMTKLAKNNKYPLYVTELVYNDDPPQSFAARIGGYEAHAESMNNAGQICVKLWTSCKMNPGAMFPGDPYVHTLCRKIIY